MLDHSAMMQAAQVMGTRCFDKSDREATQLPVEQLGEASSWSPGVLHITLAERSSSKYASSCLPARLMYSSLAACPQLI